VSEESRVASISRQSVRWNEMSSKESVEETEVA
jgi:hypothetical protein